MKSNIKHTATHFLLIFYFITIPNLIFSLEPLSVNYTIKNGLPSNEIYKTIHDKKGNLWIATDDGITCFDGKNFIYFNESKGLRNPVIFELYEDQKGRIWFINYENEIGYIHLNKVFFIKAKIKDDVSPSYLKSIYLQKNGTLWVSSIGSGKLFRLSPPYTKYSLVLKNQTGIVKIGDKNILFDNVFSILKSRSKVFKFYTLKNEKINFNSSIQIKNYEFNRFSSLYSPNSSENYYLTNHTIYHFKNRKLIKKIENDNDIIIANEFQNLLFVGVRGNGLYIYDKKNNFKLLHHYFKHLTVTGINKQQSNGFWISTLENGIFYVNNFGSTNYRLKDIGLNKIKSIQSIDKNNFYFLNTNEQIYFRNNEKVEILPFKGYYKLYLNGNLLNVGSKECTFYDINSKKRYLFFDSYFNFEVSYTHLEQIDNNNYILTHTGIWDLKKIANKKFSKSDRFSNTIYISKNHIFTFKYDKFRKGFWFSKIDGIYFVDLKKNITFFGKKFKAIKSRVNEFEIDENQNIWCATRGQGVFKISKDLKITHFNSKNGLLSNNCKTIELDKHQNLWVGTTKGMNVIFNKSNVCAPSFLINQFVNEEILDIHFNKNTLFVGTDNGLLKFDDLLLSYFNQSLIHLNKLNVIEHEKKSNYSLNFSCNFHDPSSCRKWILEYRIPSVSSKWIQSNKSEIEVFDLPYGKHNIEIRALSNAGYSKNTIKKTFYIPPKFYQTWWFFILCIISIILFLYLFYKFIQSQTKKRERNCSNSM